MPLSPKVTVSEGGIHGRSWFANDDIKKGEWTWIASEWDTKSEFTVDFKTFATWPIDKQKEFLELAYQIDDDTLCGQPFGTDIPAEILKENFVNHSCDGNMWYEPEGDNSYRLIACRDIKKGEELYYDYALTEGGPHFKIDPCLCGKASCRKVITGDDYLRKDLQQKYDGHFLPYITKRIEKIRNQ